MSPASTCWHVERHQLQGPLAAIVSRWHLEGPTNGSPVGDSEIAIGGWAIGTPEHHHALHLALQAGGETLSYPLMMERPDVIRHVYAEDPSFHPQLVCGFLHLLDRQMCIHGFTVGFEVDGVIRQAATIRPVPASV